MRKKHEKESMEFIFFRLVLRRVAFIYPMILIQSFSDHHLTFVGWLNFEFSYRYHCMWCRQCARGALGSAEAVSRFTGTDRNGLSWIPKRTL